MLSQAQKVFSKHHHGDIIRWGDLLAEHYYLLHSCEKPMDLRYTRPFSNTEDMKEFTPKIDVNAMKEEEKKEGREEEKSPKAERKQLVNIDYE
jgi:hypothetical protein